MDTIYYKLKCDWANTYEMDFFGVKCKEGFLIYDLDSEVYQYVDTYLTKEDMKILSPEKGFGGGRIAFSYWDAKIPAYENLKFDTFGSAMNYLSKKANANRWKLNRISIDRKTGYWILYAQTEYAPNECIFAELNLNTGKTDIRKASCSIF